MKDNNRWKGEPKLGIGATIEFYRKCLKLVGRDFDSEFEEYQREKLMTTHDEVVDINLQESH
jgi:hypothetical protein